ncbi:MAG: hypothetical protein LC107_04520 [Chitinophagales bacterium]|nr:hypothetical protein [Chitinophagales bacterium]
MESTVNFTYWVEADGKFLGYLNDFADYWTQGNDLQDLKEHLIDLCKLFTEEKIVGIRKVDQLIIS